MKFTAYKYRIIKYKPSTTKMLFWNALFILGFVFILHLLNEEMPLFENINNLTLPVLLIGIFSFISAYIYQFYDFENIENEKDGHIELNEKGITIDHKNSYDYMLMTDIRFGVISYYNEKINMHYRNPVERRSLGIRNYITFSTYSNTFKVNFKLENEIHLIEMEKTIFELVQSEN